MINKFKQPPQVAVARLNSLKHTSTDARQKHEPAEYVYKVIRRAKAAGLNTTVQQLKYAYDGVEFKLRVMLDEPRIVNTIDEFLNATECKKQIWFSLYQDRQIIQNGNSAYSYTSGKSYGYATGRVLQLVTIIHTGRIRIKNIRILRIGGTKITHSVKDLFTIQAEASLARRAAPHMKTDSQISTTI